MAARYLLIEFDDEAAASRLRAQIDNASRAGKPFRVVGLFAKPTNFCRCGTWITDRASNSTLKRGKKLGWSMCSTCGKPAPLMSHLRNLISPKDIISPPRYDIVDDKGQKVTKDISFYTYGLTANAKRI